ncbi:alanine:cation symporter family protein [Lachnoclostridium pacaense]|uniref:alanine/glycine:cation symporter family protein n=1 Tax=Enterocloster hominis (ex Hitch et al. 2024) TaxID=1917870 RepID=UPI001D0FB569|nr:alanine/glycine:cation symporter family protein [Lachnoclostridium pacaense]MCC2875273.1 alanine:cation symporter family protein [Lachnoclostridium pacaense]
MVIVDRITQVFVKVVTSLNELLWGDLFILQFSNGETQFGISLLVLLLIPAGLYFTFKTRFLPFRLFPEMIRATLEKDSSKDKDTISGVQALIIATATRVGMGNLAGVVAAISFGGSGAVFWMWITALIGSSSAFIESTLAQIYKEKDPLYGGYRGGPAYFMDRIRIITKIKREDAFVQDVHREAEYIASDEQTYYTKGCRLSFLGIAFALSGLLCWAGISQVVANSVTSAFKNAFNIPQVTTTVVLVAISALIVLRRNATVKVLDRIVPVVACSYFIIAMFIIFKNITYMPTVFGGIFSQAFGLKPIMGGGLGAVVMNGVKRGLFSNEAGSGSAPCAAAAAEVNHPAKQGLIQSLGVFIDTLVICSCSAFIMLLAPSEVTQGLVGMDLLQAAMNYHLGKVGVIFIAVILFMFSLSNFVGILFYARSNVAYLFGDTWAVQTCYKIFALLMLFAGGVAAYSFVWDLGDLGVGLMTIFNMIAIIPLSGQAIAALKDYEENYIKKRAGEASGCPAVK